MIESNDEPTVGVANRMRLSHTISFKLDVCNHLQSVNGNVTQTAAFFGIRRKQVRYYKTRAEVYRWLSNKTSKKNCILKSNSRCRAKYFDQEKKLYEWLILAREDGMMVTKSLILREWSRILAEDHIENMKSNGWLQRFLKRYDLKSRRITTSGRKMPDNLSNIIHSYLDSIKLCIEKQGLLF